MSEQSYIVRIYRQSREIAGKDSLDGIVEIPESGQRAAFHDVQGLWNILEAGLLARKKQGKVNLKTTTQVRGGKQGEVEE